MPEDKYLPTQLLRLRALLQRISISRRIQFLFAPGLLLIAIAVYFWVPQNTTFATLLDVLAWEAPTFVFLGIGVSLVIACGHIDLSQPGVIAITGALFGVATLYGVPLPLAIGGCLLLAGLLGAFLGWAAYEGVSSLIATWSVAAILVTAVVWISDGLSDPDNPVRIAGQIVCEQVDSFAVHERAWVPESTAGAARVPVALLLAVLIVAGLLNLPRRSCAVGANIDVARLIGIPVRSTVVLAFSFSAVCSAIAGITAARVAGTAHATQFFGRELQAIAIAVLGGTLLTGGYLRLPTVILAAVFWTVLSEILIIIELPFVSSSDQTRAASAVFALVLIVPLVVFRKWLRQRTITTIEFPAVGSTQRQ